MLKEMNDSSFELIAETPRFLVVAKRGGLATVPLAKERGKKTLLSEVGNYFSEVLLPMGSQSHEGGILHRLDSETCGLVLIARDRVTYTTLKQSQQNGHFIKTYLAATKPSHYTEGFPPFPGKGTDYWVLESRFRAYKAGHKEVRPVTADSSSLVQKKGGSVIYRTTIERKGFNKQDELVYQCSLVRGFRHQVRCHLAWSLNPIVGDRLYGGVRADSLHLAAVQLQFVDPESNSWSEYVWLDPPEWTSYS